jgi:orotidine-5'-phosphate decarboxylase
LFNLKPSEMDKKFSFREMLASRQASINSLVCTGLDPKREKMPACIDRQFPSSLFLANDIALWMRDIVDGTAPATSMFKPQKAHWEAIPNGALALQSVIRHIEVKYPDIPIFLDCKRGDIGATQEMYRIAHFEIDGVHGMNFSPYMGKDCMKSLVDTENLGRAIVGLCYTSNPAAREIQDLVLNDGRYLWEVIAEKTLKWAEELGIVENAGLVMAAAYEEPPKGSGNIHYHHLARCREIIGNKLWFLIPGVGTQGGYVEQTVSHAWAGWGSMAINSSSEINFASSDEDYVEAAAKKAMELRDAIREAMPIQTC